MTHGCLVITAKGNQRQVLLHTCHTGMDIPLWIDRTPAWEAARYFSFLFDGGQGDGIRTREDCIDRIRSHGIGRLDYPPTVAASIISANPGALYVVPPAFKKDMADWSGADNPVRLRIGDDEWTVTKRDCTVTTICPSERVIAYLLEAAEKARQARRRPRGRRKKS